MCCKEVYNCGPMSYLGDVDGRATLLLTLIQDPRFGFLYAEDVSSPTVADITHVRCYVGHTIDLDPADVYTPILEESFVPKYTVHLCCCEHPRQRNFAVWRQREQGREHEARAHARFEPH